MLAYLRQHQLINRQHGFLSRQSTWTHLLGTTNDCSIAFDAVYYDFAKAFDSVSHTKLINNLDAYGIAGDVFNCLADFLHNCPQQVALPSGVSSFKHISSGNPKHETAREPSA